MPEQISPPISRKPRADAQRNRDLILAKAREAFAEGGSEVTFEDIVKRTGLGVGTLYRHFPTRDALIEAVYLTEVEKLAAAVKDLSASLSPIEALRQWMLLFIDFMSTKLAIKEALNAMADGSEQLYACSTDLLRTSINSLAERAVAAGEIRLEIEPIDLLVALSGGSAPGVGMEWAKKARKLVDVLIAGIRV